MNLSFLLAVLTVILVVTLATNNALVASLPMSDAFVPASALGSSDVFTLPLSNTDLGATSNLKKREECTSRSVTLKWRVGRWTYNGNVNNFYIKINYHREDQPNYHGFFSMGNSLVGAERKWCSLDGIWCIQYSGRDLGENIVYYYADKEPLHSAPDSRSTYQGDSVDAPIYNDCVLY